MEGDLFWAVVSDLAERFRSNSAEGTTGVVEVVTFDGQTIVPGVVQRRAPWVIFEVGPDDAGAISREIVIVRKADIRRVQMRRVRAGDDVIGFRVGTVAPD